MRRSTAASLGLLLALAPSAGAVEPTRVLVLDLEDATGGRLSAEELRTAGEAMLAELSRQPQLKVISRRDVSDLLTGDSMKMLVGCNRPDCLAPISEAVGAERMLVGSLGRLGTRSFIQLRLLDMRTASVIRRVSHVTGQADLLQDMRAAVGELLEVKARLHLINQVEGAEVFLAGARVGTLPLQPFEVDRAGELDLEVVHPDHLPYRARVSLVPGQSTQHLLRLESFGELEHDAAVRRGWAWGLTAGSAVCYGLGAYFFWKAYDHYEDYEALDPRRTSQAEYRVWQRRVEEQSAYGWVGMAVGTALLGVSLWLHLDNPAQDALDRAEGTTLGVTPTPGGVAASLRGTF